MTTLHIEHPIVDFDLWRRAFDSFAGARARAGVLSHRILRPLDFVRANVWFTAQNSPALAGTPQTRVLQPAADRAQEPDQNRISSKPTADSARGTPISSASQ